MLLAVSERERQRETEREQCLVCPIFRRKISPLSSAYPGCLDTLQTTTRVDLKVYRLKSSYDDFISVVDNFFDQRDPSTATPAEDVCGLKEGLFKKNLFGHISYEYLGQPMNFSKKWHWQHEFKPWTNCLH